MENYFLVSNSDLFLSNYEKYIKNKKQYSNVQLLKIEFNNVANKDNYIDLHGLYHYIATSLHTLTATELRNTTLVVDEFIELDKSKPLELSGDKNNFWGRILLAYPEVRIVFTQDLTDWRGILSDVTVTPFNPLFDFSGRRNLLKTNLKLVTRTKNARVIEDENSFAFFHGYITYSHRYLTKLFTTLSHLKQDKKKDEEEKAKGEDVANIVKCDLQLQDLSLGFIDKREDTHLSDFTYRYSTYSFLENVKECKNFIITTATNDDINKATIDLKKHIVVHKPTKGMYHIEEKIGLQKSSTDVSCLEGKKLNQAKIDSTATPNENSVSNTSTTENKEGVVPESTSTNDNSSIVERTGHSAPGIIAFIAEQLIARSIAILNNATSVVDAIHAATLALEAKELLNGLTPTLALQALTIQQKAEVTAECLFVGTEYNLNLEKRFEEIEKEVAMIAKHYNVDDREKVELNAQLSMIEILSGVFAVNKQFEEELECLHKATSLSLKIKLATDKWYKFINSLIYHVLQFILNRIKSLRSFLITLFVLQVIFGVLYFVFHQIYSENVVYDFSNWRETLKIFIKSVISSTKYFFTNDPDNFSEKIFPEESVWGTIVKGVQGFFSLTTISILISMFLIRMSRR